eukprot:gene3345-1694_t
MAEAIRSEKTRKKVRKAKKGNKDVQAAKWHVDEINEDTDHKDEKSEFDDRKDFRKESPNNDNATSMEYTESSPNDVSKENAEIGNDDIMITSMADDDAIKGQLTKEINPPASREVHEESSKNVDRTDERLCSATESNTNQFESNIAEESIKVTVENGKLLDGAYNKELLGEIETGHKSDEVVAVSANEHAVLGPSMKDISLNEATTLIDPMEQSLIEENSESNSAVYAQDLSYKGSTISEPSRVRQLPDVKLKETLPIIPVPSIMVEELRPFTEEQLKMFYYNPELEQITVFIDQFLQNVVKDTHEFYDLVNTHYKCRLHLLKIMDQIKATRSGIASTCENIWITKKETLVFEGFCQDRNLVKETVHHEIAEFNEQEASTINRHLKDLRSFVHEDFQLSSYNSQLAKIRVECYIHEMIDSSPLFKGITTRDQISAALPGRLHKDDLERLCDLQDAITILFSFKRLGAVEEEFCKDVDTWLVRLISTLQRAGALPDHFFILNHVIRCPPGSIVSIASFIQFPDFQSIVTNEVWNSPLVHHFVVMLATVALPIKERSSFLMKYKHLMKPTTMRSMSWTLVDEDREEDENPEDTWHMLLENDLVAIFEQFPFENLFHYLLRMETGHDEIGYSVTNSTSNDIVHLLSFTSCIVKLLGKLFDTYNMLRYRQFVKRISRMIRWIVQIVSDHWCAYRSWRMEICGDSDKDIPKFLTVVPQFSLERLQLEFDQFFGKASEQILNSQSTSALQFLAAMPYEAISTNAAWSLLNRLVRTPVNQNSQNTTYSSEFLRNASNASGEMVFFITSLSFMAISRSTDDQEFIECAAKCIVEITYSDEKIRDFNERDCRDSLAAISSAHPFVMSSLLHDIGQLMEKLQMSCVYLLKALPFDVWIPRVPDLELLRSWLLEHPLDSIKSKMARAVFSKINFDVNQESGGLFLPQKYHFSVAVMLVEVFGSCVQDGPGGLKTLEYQNNDLISQVSALACQSINKILYSKVQDEFLKWCWDVLLSLKLHSFDFDADENDDQDRHVLLALDENRPNDSGSWFGNALSCFTKFDPANTDLEHCPVFLNVQRALDTNGLLASYVAFSMTSLGHSPERFVEQGVKLMTRILESGWVDATLRILSNVVPLFLKCPDMILSCHDFSQILDTLVHLDANKAGYTEKLWQYPEPGLHSQMLASIITALVKAQSNRGLLSSMMSWISPNAPITLLDIKSQPDYSYYAFAVLQMEQMYESKIGIMKELAVKMVLDSNLQVDIAYKKAAPHLTASYLPPLQNLTIYRWADQGMATDCNHPLLPIIWQQFFLLFLQKQNTADGLPSRLGIGDRFFENDPYSSMVKKMRAHLYKIASHHKEKSTKEVGDEDGGNTSSDIKSHIHDETMHASLSSLYQAMALWLEEPRLHDPDLFLNALPEIYKPGELEKIFQGDDSLWLHFVDKRCIETEVGSVLSMWTMTLNKSGKAKPSARSLEETRQQRPTGKCLLLPSQRIIKRLNRENKPQPPCSIEATTSPIQDVPMQLLLTRPRLIQDLNDDLERVLLFAKRMCIKLDEHIALDEEYSEVLSDLYDNMLVQEILRLPCDGKKRPCAGPAKVVARYLHKHLKDHNARRLEENRNTWEKNLEELTQPVPYDLCTGAVNVERVITKLLKSLQYANANQKESLEDAGIQLFYLLASLINGDVKRCHPAIQFFSSSTEVLGKEMIADNEKEQLRLIKTIFSEEATVSFLAPHFSPHHRLRTFLNLYVSVTEYFSPETITTSFVLLSKFDIRSWLSLEPALSERIFFARTIIAAVAKFGVEPTNELEMLFCLYRSHFVFLLSHKFPRQYSEVLRLMVEASDKETLPFLCWGDFLNVIRCDNGERSLSPSYEYVELGTNEVIGTVDWLADIFAKISQARYHSNSKLYTAWRLYIPYVARFLKFLFTKLIVHYDSCGFPSTIAKERFLSKTWNQIFAVYRPWIVPHKADKSWPVLFVEDSILLVQSFTESCRLIADFTAFNSDYNIGLNMVWAFYCAEIASALNQENSLQIYHSLFATLPWQSFYPSLQDLERMLELYYVNVPAFHFLGTILCDLDWTLLISKYEQLGYSDRLINYLNAVLRTFVTLSTIKPFMAQARSKFENIANAFLSFPLKYLSVDNVENACGWFGENCDPAAVLEDEVYKNTTIKILKAICYFADAKIDSEEGCYLDAHTIIKQNIFVQTLVKIILRATSLKDFVPTKMDSLISTFLADIERWGLSQSQNGLTHLYCSLLALLNSIGTSSVLKSIESQIFSFLVNTNSDVAIISMLSAGYRVIASLDQLVELSEITIENFFNKQADEDLDQAWTRILKVLLVPELNQGQFLRKALTKQCWLTVYVYNLQRLSLTSNLAEDLTILTELFHWCLQLPPSPLCPEKTLLIWWQIMKGVKNQIFGNTEDREYGSLARYLLSFANSCQQYCEDKSYAGILGAIGLGKKSSFPPEFRLIARSMHVFLLAQIPHSGTRLRCFPDAPGDISGQVGIGNQEAKVALQNLVSLKKSKTYATFKEEINWLSDFIANPKTCLANGDEILIYTCKKFYSKVSYIAATISKGSEKQPSQIPS